MAEWQSGCTRRDWGSGGEAELSTKRCRLLAVAHSKRESHNKKGSVEKAWQRGRGHHRGFAVAIVIVLAPSQCSPFPTASACEFAFHERCIRSAAVIEPARIARISGKLCQTLGSKHPTIVCVGHPCCPDSSVNHGAGMQYYHGRHRSMIQSGLRLCNCFRLASSSARPHWREAPSKRSKDS